MDIDENESLPDSRSEPRRESVWSVSEGWLTAYFILFTIQFIAIVSLIVWYETVAITHDSAIETTMRILGKAATMPMLCATTSYILTESGRLSMVISNWVERKLEERRIKREKELIQQGFERGFEKGREHERALRNGKNNGADDDEPSSKGDG